MQPYKFVVLCCFGAIDILEESAIIKPTVIKNKTYSYNRNSRIKYVCKDSENGSPCVLRKRRSRNKQGVFLGHELVATNKMQAMLRRKNI